MQLGSDTATSETLWRRTNATNLQVNRGDVFTIKATQGLDDHARIDFIDFIAKDFTGAPITWPGSGSGSGSYGGTIRIEDTQFNNAVSVYDTDNASGGTASWVLSPDGSSNVSAVFNGSAGLYNIDIGYFDALGSANLEVKKGSTTLDSWALNNDNLFWSNNFISRNIASNIQVNPGDIFTFSGTGNLLEYAIVDYLDFTPIDVSPSLPPSSSPQTIRFEAEHLNNPHNNIPENGGFYSNGQVWTGRSDLAYGEESFGTLTFDGLSGYYDVIVGYYDEIDGVAQLKLKHGDIVLDHWYLDQQLVDPSQPYAYPENFVARTVSSALQINSGDTFTLNSIVNQGEINRVDYLEFVPVNSSDSSESENQLLSSYELFYQNALSAIASQLGWNQEDVLIYLNTTQDSLTGQHFFDIVNDILIPNGWGSWSSGGSGSGWGGGSSGSCGWGCQEFEELFHSHSFGAVTTDSDHHDHDHVDDHDHMDDLTGMSSSGAHPRSSRAARHSGVNPTSNGRQGLKKRAYSGQGIFNQDHSHEITDSIDDLQADFFQSNARAARVTSHQEAPDIASGLSDSHIGLDGVNHLMMTNSTDIIAALL